MASYADKLKDDRWLDYRDRIIARDGGRCCDCGGTDRLEVHHLAYWFGSDPWDYEPEALRTLCRTCHERAEQKRYELLVNWGRLREWERDSVASQVREMIPRPPAKKKVEYRDPADEAFDKWFASLDSEKQGEMLLRLIEFRRSCMDMHPFEQQKSYQQFRDHIVAAASLVEVAQ